MTVDQDVDRESEDEPFNAVADEPPQAPKLPPPFNWWTLSQTSRQIVVDSLETFVAQLTVNYELDGWLRPCWFKHPSIIQELLALWQWRNFQQYINAQIPQAALDFHIQLGPALARIKAAYGRLGCEGTGHREWAPPPWIASEEENKRYHEELAQWYS